MSNKFSALAVAAGAVLAILPAATIRTAAAKENRPALQQDNSQSVPEPQQADGRRHGRPAETYAVAPGTKFLVVLSQDLTS